MSSDGPCVYIKHTGNPCRPQICEIYKNTSTYHMDNIVLYAEIVMSAVPRGSWSCLKRNHLVKYIVSREVILLTFYSAIFYTVVATSMCKSQNSGDR